MAIARFFPQGDTWITNACIDSPANRATSASLGTNPTITLFKVTSSYPYADAELSRGLIKFDVGALSTMVSNQQIPASGVQYVLKAYNYVVGATTPSSFDVEVCAVPTYWDEGLGQDDINWQDSGYANWYSATSTNNWVSGGGDYSILNSGTQHFSVGDEDLEVDVTAIVQAWLTGTLQPNGLMMKLSTACETNNNDYYKKVFYSRETHTVEKVPCLEARWNDTIKDNRGNFAYNNPNALYLYNLVRGSLKNAATPVTVRLQDNWMAQSCSYQQTFTASQASTGVYSAPVSVYNTNPGNYSASWVDIWQDGNGMCLMTGNLFPLILTGSQVDPYNDFVVDAVGLKRLYSVNETARITVNVRKNFSNSHLAIHTASLDSAREYMENMYFSILNNTSGDTVIPFGTGSIPYTKLSYNGAGNYFDLAMNSFVPGFVYRLIFAVQFNQFQQQVIDQNFIFRVE